MQLTSTTGTLPRTEQLDIKVACLKSLQNQFLYKRIKSKLDMNSKSV